MIVFIISKVLNWVSGNGCSLWYLILKRNVVKSTQCSLIRRRRATCPTLTPPTHVITLNFAILLNYYWRQRVSVASSVCVCVCQCFIIRSCIAVSATSETYISWRKLHPWIFVLYHFYTFCACFVNMWMGMCSELFLMLFWIHVLNGGDYFFCVL